MTNNSMLNKGTINLNVFYNEEDQWKPEGYHALTMSCDKKILNRRVYRHVQNPDLFKFIEPDGSIRYTDGARVTWTNLVDGTPDDFSYTSAYISKMMDQMFPIQFPYVSQDIRVQLYRYDSDEILQDFDSIMKIDSISIDNNPFEKIDRFFRYSPEKRNWEEIDEAIYCQIENKYKEVYKR